MGFFQRRRDESTLAAEVPSCESPAEQDRIRRGQLAAARRLGRTGDARRLVAEINDGRQSFNLPKID
jgi:hypothetical protein